MRIAFVVGEFPLPTETFIINQIADLIDKGASVEVFAFRRGRTNAISDRYRAYRMSTRTHYLYTPKGSFRQLLAAIPQFVRAVCVGPRALGRLLRGRRDETEPYRVRDFFLAAPFLGRRFDVIHCHFGTIATEYLEIRRLLSQKTPMVTTFYGFDASRVLTTMPAGYYDDLKRECGLFFVMSEDMKRRLVAAGFDGCKVSVLPVSIDVQAYPFGERHPGSDETARLLSVGRFVEKKGFDDIVRALAIVKNKTSRPFMMSLVGEGPQEEQLRNMVRTSGLDDVVEFRGYMPVEAVVEACRRAHLFVQPSKTAADGDME